MGVAMWVGWIALGLIGCNEPAELLSDELEIPLDLPPALTLESVEEVEEGVVFARGSVTDLEQPSSTVLLGLGSSVDGALWVGNGAPDDTWSWEGALSPGAHVLTLFAEDVGDNRAEISSSIWVRGPNVAPSCAILSPEDHSTWPVGNEILLAGQVEDPNGDEVMALWRSSLMGSLFVGTEMSIILSTGMHTLTLVGNDGFGGRCEASIQVQIGG